MKLSAKYVEIFFLVKGKRLHLFLCLALLLLLTLALLISRSLSYLPAGLFLYCFIVSGIYMGRWICRQWLITNRLIKLIAIVIVALAVFDVIGTTSFVYFFNPEMPFNHILETAINMAVLSFFLLFSGFFITVTRSAIREKMNSLVLAEQKKESELGLLRSQLSPHFLFNTLNNMYSLSINKPAQMPALLLKLSELLRYSVYGADQLWVTLSEEIVYLGNYIALENIRLSDRLLLTVNMEKASAGINIAPMLLIIFVENAFKHARNTSAERIYISLNLKVVTGTIYFEVENSCSEEATEQIDIKPNSGFGITNARKRLNLLYPNRYGLKQTRTNNKFKVELWLKEK